MILNPAPRVNRRRGLLVLLRYATLHHHSRQWIPAILVILARQEVARG
jgi:hypothetical protein